jgi:tripartite-type tricarboxylate transporter receptor subunit TctC
MLRRRTQIIALVAAVSVAAGGIACRAVADSFPSRPVKMILPFAAGGPSDVIGRIIADRMRVALGQPVIVENVPGALGTLGVGRAVRAAPDGYTLSLGTWPTHVLNGALFQLPYDLVSDFEPISLLISNPQLLVGRKDLPAQDLKELVAWLKANPGKALQAASGQGSTGHLAGLYFQKATGTQYEFVFYRDNAQQLQDLISGRIDLMFDFPASSLPYIRAGSIKVYAVTDKVRMAGAPDIPTVDEAGLPDFHFVGWHALFAPKGTPKPVIGTLNTAVVQALADPAVRKRLVDLGQEFFPADQLTPQALAAYQRAEMDKWWPIIRAAGIRLE